MANGRVEEFDTPLNLFKARGAFYEMAQKSSISEQDLVVSCRRLPLECALRNI